MLKNLYHKYSQIITYLIFGVLTTFVNYLMFFGLEFLYPKIDPVLNNTIAWLVAFLFAFFTNRKWVFKSKNEGWQKYLREFWLFFLARVFSLIVDDFIVWLGISIMHQNTILVKFLSQIIIVIINYSLSKFIFKGKK